MPFPPTQTAQSAFAQRQSAYEARYADCDGVPHGQLTSAQKQHLRDMQRTMRNENR